MRRRFGNDPPQLSELAAGLHAVVPRLSGTSSNAAVRVRRHHLNAAEAANTVEEPPIVTGVAGAIQACDTARPW